MNNNVLDEIEHIKEEIGEIKKDMKINWDYAYIAGLMDADGCFCIRKKVNVYQPVISINQTKIDSLYLIQKHFNSKISFRKPPTTRKNRQPFYQINIQAKERKKFLEKIMPHLVIKQEQAENLLELDIMIEERRKKGIIHRKLTTKELIIRENFYLRVKYLNAIGIKAMEIKNNENEELPDLEMELEDFNHSKSLLEFF